MADESKETEELEETEPAAEEPEADGVDWKALARKWERQAKANAKKAARQTRLRPRRRARAGSPRSPRRRACPPTCSGSSPQTARTT